MKLDYDCVRDLLLTLEEELEGITVDDDVFGEYIAYPSVLLSAICQNELASLYSATFLIFGQLKIEPAKIVCISCIYYRYIISDVSH